MGTTYIKGARIFTGSNELTGYAISVAEGKVVGLVAEADCPKDAKTIDLTGKNIAPGFIDIQLNGGYYTILSSKPDVETLEEMTQACLDHGTPYVCPTLVSSPVEVIFQAIDAMKEAMKTNKSLLGLHVEGPFISPDRKGAHNLDVINSADDEMLRQIIERGKGAIKLITVACERLSPEIMQLLIDSDIQVSIGHSNATYEEATHYFNKGVHLITHLYNAMSPFTHRAPGVVGAALDHPDVFTPLILDGRHCHYASARLAHQKKGDKFVLITDAAVLGRRMKEIPFDGLHAVLTEDGFYYNPDGALAGSAISLGEAVKNAVEHLHVSVREAIEMVTAHPARAIEMQDEIGYIAPGYPARFTVFDSELNEFTTLEC